MLYGVLRIRINPRFISLSCLSQGFSGSLKGCNARAAAEIVLPMREYRRYKGISLEHVLHISFPFLLSPRFLVKRSINYGPSLAIIYSWPGKCFNICRQKSQIIYYIDSPSFYPTIFHIYYTGAIVSHYSANKPP